jgi:hypothetical protein
MSEMGAANSAQIALASLWIMTESLNDHLEKGGVLSEFEEDMLNDVMRVLIEGRKELEWILTTIDEGGSSWREWVHVMMKTVWRTSDVVSDMLLEVLELHEQAEVVKPPPHLTLAYLSARQAHEAIIGYCETGEVEEDTPSDEEIKTWLDKEVEGYDGQ